MYNYSMLLARIVRKASVYFYYLYAKLIAKNNVTVTKDKGVSISYLMSKASFIPGMISPDEAKALFFLSTLSELKGDVLEIGSWLGRSTTFLASGCKVTGNGVVHAVDTFKGNPGKEEMYEAPLGRGETISLRFKSNINKMKLDQYVKIYEMPSKQAKEKIKNKFRLIFIDGCHDYDAVKNDILRWEKHLILGGIVTLHDYSDSFPGSKKAINEALLENENYLLLFLSDTLIAFKKVS